MNNSRLRILNINFWCKVKKNSSLHSSEQTHHGIKKVLKSLSIPVLAESMQAMDLFKNSKSSTVSFQLSVELFKRPKFSAVAVKFSISISLLQQKKIFYLRTLYGQPFRHYLEFKVAYRVWQRSKLSICPKMISVNLSDCIILCY